MKTHLSVISLATATLIALFPIPGRAQIPMSTGPYAQNFDSLATSGTANAWVNNSTLTGWYASRVSGGPITTYRSDNGNTGALYSYGVAGVSNITDRALGSTSSGTPGTLAYGVRFTNDTVATFTNFLITYTGEQWRNGGNASPQTLAFSYRVSSSPILDADAANADSWTSVSALDFTTPTVGASSGTLDGNASSNRQLIANVLLSGVTVGPSQEIFFRWSDINDTGNDHGFGVDDLSILYNVGDTIPPSAPVFISHPQDQIVFVGDSVTFNALAVGNPAPTFQWVFNGTNVPNATNASLTLNNVTLGQSGSCFVVASNSFGSTNSDVATLTVIAPVPPVPGFSLMTYNTKGFGTTDRSTNSPEVQAIGRQLKYLNPDVVTFQEIVYTNTWQLTNWVIAYLPGYYLVTNSATDGILRSAIASRYPITRSKSWLPHADLAPFGYVTNDFTRDLFEAQIVVPGFPQPLHVFTTHLKSGTGDSQDAAKRAAEAGAISNFFVMIYSTSNSLHPYVLTGDLNEDIAHPATGSAQPIQRLTNGNTGLVLTTPVNPSSNGEQTFSIQGSLNRRYDYILPNTLLFSNIASSQVFRSDLLPSPPPPLLGTDSETGSDHLPVFTVFNSPYAKPFKLLSMGRTNLSVTLKWESVPGQPYRVETSTNLTVWTTLASNLVAAAYNTTFATNLNDPTRYFRIYRVP